MGSGNQKRSWKRQAEEDDPRERNEEEEEPEPWMCPGWVGREKMHSALQVGMHIHLGSSARVPAYHDFLHLVVPLPLEVGQGHHICGHVLDPNHE